MSLEDIFASRGRAMKEKALNNFNSSIPPFLRGYDINELLNSDSDYDRISIVAKNSLREYINNPTQFLLLTGPSGLGKTAVGASISYELLLTNKVKSALYVEANSLFNEISFGDEYGNRNAIQKYSRPQLLFLDDIGAGSISMTDIRKQGLFSIINQRWSHGKITIMTTNLPIERKETYSTSNNLTIRDVFDDASWSRISSPGVLTRISFSGESLRGKQNYDNDDENIRKEAEEIRKKKNHHEENKNDVRKSTISPSFFDIVDEEDNYEEIESNQEKKNESKWNMVKFFDEEDDDEKLHEENSIVQKRRNSTRKKSYSSQKEEYDADDGEDIYVID